MLTENIHAVEKASGMYSKILSLQKHKASKYGCDILYKYIKKIWKATCYVVQWLSSKWRGQLGGEHSYFNIKYFHICIF